MALDFTKWFEKYKMLVSEADQAFKRVEKDYSDCVRCQINCCDCCYAFFELFLIESVYVNYHFNMLIKRKERREVLRRAEKADIRILQIKKRLHLIDAIEVKDRGAVMFELAEERVRCPFLNDGDLCILYHHRPITCRLYGIPTAIGGVGHTCGKSGFQTGVTYPTVNLDLIHNRLFKLSKDLLKGVGSLYLEKSSILVPLSTALRTTYNHLILGFKCSLRI